MQCSLPHGSQAAQAHSVERRWLGMTLAPLAAPITRREGEGKESRVWKSIRTSFFSLTVKFFGIISTKKKKKKKNHLFPLQIENNLPFQDSRGSKSFSFSLSFSFPSPRRPEVFWAAIYFFFPFFSFSRYSVRTNCERTSSTSVIGRFIARGHWNFHVRPPP